MDLYLKLSHVCKSFGRAPALRSVGLELGADELLVVLGPTGAGKTTLLRTIAGLESPDSGRIEMGGRDMTSASPSARDVAFVFQNFSLYPDWTVGQSLAFPLKAPGRGMGAGEIRERVEWAASLLQIGRLLDRKAAELSGGEMQRVAIGRAIVRRPRLFLMDEPLSNLDAKLREVLRVELAVLRRKLGTPMIYVTHDQAEALSMGDRLVVLSEGRILQVGAPDEVYARPVSPAVARQLGQPPINLLRVRREEGYWVAAPGLRVMPATGDEQEMLVGVRPEHIAPTGGARAGLVRVVEDTGAASILLVNWAGHPLHLLVNKGQSFRPGDEVFPLVDPDRAVLWQSCCQTERRDP